MTPTAITITATVSTLTPIPVITLTSSPAPVITVVPTPQPALRVFHVLPIAIGEINVLQSICESRATTWFLYDYGMTQVFDEDENRRCLEAKTL